MLRSFFPNPKLFFSSAGAWIVVAFIVWFSVGDQLGAVLNLGANIDMSPGRWGGGNL